MINGVCLTQVKQIFHPKGNVFHAIKKSDVGFNGFGEAYFSTINFSEIKPWKKHLSMTLNFVVPSGEIRFVIYDDRENSSTKGNFMDVTLSHSNYKRLTIPPGLWVAFEGIGMNLNLLLNIADLEHDPQEIIRKTCLEDINYKW
ncbi:MAG: dTDP-4-dehydrorhamnose 3,5-epimerase [Bacteroidetes bacterium GWA2_32_17]|nr:MAG: dTDP-4-dehydrorhamnose 3,5-epimerase [Bacteroidetes bacterium GWA2_32_17]